MGCFLGKVILYLSLLIAAVCFLGWMISVLFEFLGWWTILIIIIILGKTIASTK